MSGERRATHASRNTDCHGVRRQYGGASACFRSHRQPCLHPIGAGLKTRALARRIAHVCHFHSKTARRIGGELDLLQRGRLSLLDGLPVLDAILVRALVAIVSASSQMLNSNGGSRSTNDTRNGCPDVFRITSSTAIAPSSHRADIVSSGALAGPVGCASENACARGTVNTPQMHEISNVARVIGTSIPWRRRVCPIRRSPDRPLRVRRHRFADLDRGNRGRNKW